VSHLLWRASFSRPIAWALKRARNPEQRARFCKFAFFHFPGWWASFRLPRSTQGTGGVSVFAIQIASALGAKVIATSSKDENLETTKALGAWQTINYRKHPDWEKKVLELTDGKGVDQLLDVVGGDGLNQSIEATRVGGQIFQIGFLQGQIANVNLMRIIFRQTVIRGIAVGSARAFGRMNDFLNEHKIRPVLDTVYSFDLARDAYEHLARGAFGKIVIRVNS
jgi:NADPH:quinone reductase-like Zn-dependent oxidoreductase